MPANKPTSSANHRTYSFGEFVLDVDRGALLKAGADIKLRPKSYEMLGYLVERRGRLVSKGELLDALWSHADVTEDAVTQCLIDIRRAICDESQTMIRTVPRRGYIFDIDVDEPRDKKAWPVLSFGRRNLAAALAIVVGVLGVWSVAIDTRNDSSASPVAAESASQSIAVLAFSDMSESQDQKFFAEGMSEEIINLLTQIDSLKVIARTSSFSFADQNIDIATITDRLNVNYVLEGSVRTSGQQIRVTAQLIDTRSESHLWSKTFNYELNLDNVLKIQDEIAAQVVDALQVQLLPGDSGKLVASGPANLEALNLYHDGMAFLRRIEIGDGYEDAVEAAIEIFEAAIIADPGWAPPYAAIGRVYHFGKNIGDIAENLRISKDYVTEAIRLDGNYAPAYNSLGYVLTVEGDYAGAIRAYDRASSLGAISNWGYAILMGSLGRNDESIEAYRQAVTHDPLSVPVRMQLIDQLSCAGKYSETIDAANSQLESYPENAWLAITLADALIRTGNVEKGLQIANGVTDEDAEKYFRFHAMLAVAGREESGRAALNTPELNAPHQALAAVSTLIALGEEERALTRIEDTVDFAIENYLGFTLAGRLQCYPEVQSLAGEPRYEAVLRRLGVPN